MPSKAEDLRIVCIAPAMIGQMWPLISPWLLKAQLAMGNSLRDAMETLTEGTVAAAEGRYQLWAILDHDSRRCLGAFVTEIIEERGKKLVWVTSLAGEGILRWGPLLSERMAEFAKAEGCKAIRFAGRKGLLRAYRKVRIVDDYDAQSFVFERAVS
jgi:hypothetical protein